MPTSKLVLIGAGVESTGHPSQCTEPAPGTVNGSSNITVNGTGIYDKGNADVNIPTHAHSYIPPPGPGCTSKSAHTIDQDPTHSITVNGKTMYVKSDTGTDPGSGGTVSFTGTGGNSSITLTETE